MSELSLPLFPLNTVLFPRMPLSLNVFEERYKSMITRCLEEERPFGVVLIKEGVEVGGSAVPERVGTIAQIHAIEHLDDGRLSLFTEGATRFRIEDLDAASHPYLVGTVVHIHDEETEAEEVAPLVRQTRELFKEYFDILVGYAGVELPEYDLPTSPEYLSFVMAAVIQTEVAEKQVLLELTDTRARLRRIFDLLSSDIDKMRRAVDRSESNGILATRLPAEWRKKFDSRN